MTQPRRGACANGPGNANQMGGRPKTAVIDYRQQWGGRP